MRLINTIKWFTILILGVLGSAVFAEEIAGFEVKSLSAYRVEERYLMDANIDYRFSEKVTEALRNGVPLTLELEVQLRREGAWIWESDQFEVSLRYQIRYHALAELYQVIDLQTGDEQDFVTRSAALLALGKIHGVHLLDASALDPGERYILSLRTRLDIEALPLPLRPMAYLTPSWNLSSGWKQWPLAR